MLTRRGILRAGAATTAMLAAPHIGRAAGKLSISCHAVHKKVITTGPGGDITEEWRKANGVEIEWLTFGVTAANERAFQEASLGEGHLDVTFLLDRFDGPQFATLFEDLGTWNAKTPIPDYAEFPQGMLDAHRFGSKQVGIPFRHATHGLHMNRTFMKERGIAGPPKTLDEAVADFRKLSFTRDGTKVYGLVFDMEDPSCAMDWVRAYGGDFITHDYKVVVDQPGAVKAMTTLHALFHEGVIPRNVVNMKTEDVITFMQQGRAAMTDQPFTRTFNYNDPKASKFPGQFEVTPLPLGVDGQPIPAKTSVWGMALPRNTSQKALAWSLVRHLSLPESTIRAAMNGNGPVRPSAYKDPRVIKSLPYAAQEAEALKHARLVVPGFANAAKAMDMFIEAMGAVLLDAKQPQAAMTELAARVRPLLPSA